MGSNISTFEYNDKVEDRILPIHISNDLNLIKKIVSTSKNNHIDTQSLTKGKTPLHYANNNPDKVKLLLEFKADVNILDNDGNTCLFNCTNFEAFQMLSQTDINFYNINKDGQSILDELFTNYEINENLIDGLRKSSNGLSESYKNPSVSNSYSERVAISMLNEEYDHYILYLDRFIDRYIKTNQDIIKIIHLLFNTHKDLCRQDRNGNTFYIKSPVYIY